MNHENGKINAILPVYDFVSSYPEDEQMIYEYLINNHITSWFNIKTDDYLKNYQDWPKVNQYNNTCFCNGVLYHNIPENTDSL